MDDVYAALLTTCKKKRLHPRILRYIQAVHVAPQARVAMHYAHMRHVVVHVYMQAHASRNCFSYATPFWRVSVEIIMIDHAS